MAERRGTKALELWCRRMTEGYPGVKIDNMTTSWRDGLAFCAMIHHFRPDLIEFEKLNKSDVFYNNELAFTTAEKYLGIPALLDADDMAAYEVPDRLSILTYLSQFYQVFAAQDSPNRLKRPSTSVSAEKSQITKTPGPPPKMAFVVGVPRRDPCQKCRLPVFLAERLTVGKQVYHRTCLKCARCGSQLTPGSFYETEVDGEYCCETCPDEEEEEQGVASNGVLLRGSLQQQDKLPEGAAAAAAAAKVVRSSIADRLAFFEKNKGPGGETAGVAGSKLFLQKSVSDEEKTKSLQHMEVTTMSSAVSPYKPNSALSSFLNDTIDNESDKVAEAGAESAPERQAAADNSGSKAPIDIRMNTSDSADEAETESSLEQSLPALPTTQPPELHEENVSNKRFTATAQLQLASTTPPTNDEEIEVKATVTSQQQQPENRAINMAENDAGVPTINSTGPEKIKTNLQFNLTAMSAATTANTVTTTNDNDDNANDGENNNGRVTDAAEAKDSAETEPAQRTAQKSLEIKLELSAPNDNDHVTKDKIADIDEIAVVAQAQAQALPSENFERIETKLIPSKTESPTNIETLAEQPVQLRTKLLEQEQQQEKLQPEDAATMERLSVVRARLQQFEVIANNHNNNNNAGPDNCSINVSSNNNDKLSEIDTNQLNVKLNEDSTTTASTLNKSDNTATKTPEVNLEDEAKLKAMEIDTEVDEKEESVTEVPMPMEVTDNSLTEESKPEIESTAAASDEQVEQVEITKNSLKLAAGSATHSPVKISAEEYPEDLNPFKSDDEDDELDANKENIKEQQSVTTPTKAAKKKRDSLNPFDSSDDEIELEKSSRNSTASSTPSVKVPPPRPPPPRISRNPFGEDDEDDEHFSRRSSLSSSLTKKTPVPTPRAIISQSQNPTPEPTPRLSTKTPQSHSSHILQNSSDYYGSANSLGSTPQSLQRNLDVRGSNNSLTSSAGGTIRSRKSRKAPAPPAPSMKELFPASETASSSKASTPTSSTMGSPKLGRKKRPAPAPPKPARLDPALTPPIGALEHVNNGTASKNLLSYPLQSESDSKLSDEEKALLEGKRLPSEDSLSNAESISQRSSRRLIPLDASLLDDADDDSGGGGGVDGNGGGKSDDLKQQQQLRYSEETEPRVVYRRVLVPPSMETPTRESNPLFDELNMAAHDRQLEKLKDNKEAKNRNRQSQISASSGNEDCDVSTPYNKSSYGKWKRRKGPAPALPVPPRKVLQMLPLQEIRHELEIIEVQQQGLEKQGVILEKMIRDRCEGQNGELLGGTNATEDVKDGAKSSTAPEGVQQNSKEVEDLILQLFELVNEKNELFRRQAELMYLRRQHRLEQEQADLEYEIRVLMAQPERNKTDSDKAREEALIARMVEVVQLRNEVIECLEMDRLREAEEDLSIKQRLELHSAQRDEEANSHKASAKLSKKEKKKQKEAKKLSKSKKPDADKDADETEVNDDKQKQKKKKRKFLF